MSNNMIKHGSLFTGIGGFDLAAECAGIETSWSVEWSEYCRLVNKINFPEVTQYADITQIDPSSLSRVDIISGGFPCQPFSSTGLRKGWADDRALWPYMLNIIAKIRPTWVIGENVAGFIGLGLDESIYDLETIGYEVVPFVLPAYAANALHKRDRVWIVAHTECKNESAHFGRPCATDRLSAKAVMGDGVPRIFEPPVLRAIDGVPGQMDQLRCYGNAIVPQIAYQIFCIIAKIERSYE